MKLTPLRPIETAALHEKVYDQLSSAMMDGLFPAGRPFTLHGAADLLGTSIMPVREAVRRLISERAIEMVTIRRMRVPFCSAKRLSELMKARTLIEGELVEMAATRTPKISHLNELADAASKALAGGDMAGAVVRSRIFWFTLFQESESEIYLRLLQLLWLQLGPYLAEALPRASRRDIAIIVGEDVRQAILKCLSERNAEGGRALIAFALSEAAAELRRLSLRD